MGAKEGRNDSDTHLTAEGLLGCFLSRLFAPGVCQSSLSRAAAPDRYPIPTLRHNCSWLPGHQLLPCFLPYDWLLLGLFPEGCLSPDPLHGRMALPWPRPHSVADSIPFGHSLIELSRVLCCDLQCCQTKCCALSYGAASHPEPSTSGLPQPSPFQC